MLEVRGCQGSFLVSKLGHGREPSLSSERKVGVLITSVIGTGLSHHLDAISVIVIKWCHRQRINRRTSINDSPVGSKSLI